MASVRWRYLSKTIAEEGYSDVRCADGMAEPGMGWQGFVVLVDVILIELSILGGDDTELLLEFLARRRECRRGVFTNGVM